MLFSYLTCHRGVFMLNELNEEISRLLSSVSKSVVPIALTRVVYDMLVERGCRRFWLKLLYR